jgi:hypothetical protein
MFSAHAHTQYDRKTIHVQIFLIRPTYGGINLHLKRNTKFETVAKIQHTQLAKLWSNGHVKQQFADSVKV